ncbi:hypothetical protein H340_14581 [Streptomyces mobaraensis NBRC 13819 = DSM 40847]|uniref:MDMPI C-terminal domain-containing protein n=1 Tax=Streptomyces mobaraensis (strain ATCC 29032 / DSM 40847 / JCM 4168 / NBRC 13819 / NCIMB 11159 / IPCR 16-22) TaxID=1223523 RepID=M3B1F6_STRM1|nr:hypothetical protein H340_14581 [Streptomyces mobaraensis NBRC 13819 = DSM 40847]
MAAFSRVSPAALTETLDVIGAQTARFFESVGLDAPSLGVAWAGIDPAPMWLDSARDFTEFWTHRQQIRHAVGLPTDQDPTSLSVVLDTFMRAVPHTLRTVDVPPGTQVRLEVDGPAGGAWTVTATGTHWSPAEPDADRPAALLRLDTETAWRLCTRGIQPGTALARAGIEGDRALAEAACHVVSIVY